MFFTIMIKSTPQKNNSSSTSYQGEILQVKVSACTYNFPYSYNIYERICLPDIMHRFSKHKYYKYYKNMAVSLHYRPLQCTEKQKKRIFIKKQHFIHILYVIYSEPPIQHIIYQTSLNYNSLYKIYIIIKFRFVSKNTS